ncbi:MAG: beta-eliminating lyase-related protein [Pseudomonadota bacterium]
MKHPSKKGYVQKKVAINLYQNIWEIRHDAWGHLVDNLNRLQHAEYRHADTHLAELSAIEQTLNTLEPIESYWAFPGKKKFKCLKNLFTHQHYDRLNEHVHRINTALSTQSYKRDVFSSPSNNHETLTSADAYQDEDHSDRLYFEVLVVGELSAQEETQLREQLRAMRQPNDHFIFEIVVVPSFQDALIAVLLNFNIQACVIRYRLPLLSEFDASILYQLLDDYDEQGVARLPESERCRILGEKITQLRPELDLYLVSDVTPETIAGKLCSNFRRVFYRQEDEHELYYSILQNIENRYQTPFFTALKEYSQKPTGVFHALPVSRGKSILQSNWIQDIVQFYGKSVFMAETSATSGGLDSLSEPVGPIKRAQELAARAFGSQRTFFVTNGTSTANKIVVQALIQPGDIVLLDRNCHKSHHYGMVLSGADTVYLDAYPLDEYSMYGAVPIREIKKTLLHFKREGKLERVKLVLLTNCTFDGIVYDVERVIEECLAIKPDLIFLWDEAWFAFAAFHPTYRRRTGMGAAARLREKFQSTAYQQRYTNFKKEFGEPDNEDAWLNARLVADPALARVRVYATQSTHKTLTAFRQGSMIHVYDQDFKSKAEDAFHEA